MSIASAKARHFIEHEKQFHLGVLPTEQSNPLTRGLAEVFQKNTVDGIQLLQKVDRTIVEPVRQVLQSDEFARMREAIFGALNDGGKIVFSGCGATGRVSILLESAWREFWQGAADRLPNKRDLCARMENAVFSIMTGGDYALVRSVENFEDFQQFGRRQVRDLGLGKGDVLIAISEGGETSSVIGTLHESLERGARAFFLFNNPADILCRHVERSREIIENEKVTCIPLYSGPMAVAGSTRMQATTFEMLIALAALELVLGEIVGREFPNRIPAAHAAPEDYAETFAILLDDLAAEDAISQLAGMTELEAKTYGAGGRVTYYAGSCLLDIFTDTTERAPTFMLPPFRKSDDALSPPSWAFVKHAFLPTPRAWQLTYRRAPRCLEWTPADYGELNAPESIVNKPPKLQKAELFKFLVGCEDDPSRYETAGSLAVLVCAGKEYADICGNADHPLLSGFRKASKNFSVMAMFSIGEERAPVLPVENRFHLTAKLPSSALRLWERLAVKLAFNTVSTATMALMGRLSSNWMAHVETSNKKLIDRGTRLVAELANVDYEIACVALHETIEMQAASQDAKRETPSPVFLTVKRLTKTAK